MKKARISGRLDTVGDSDVLAVILHAYTSSPAKMVDVGLAIRETLPGADLYVPSLKTGLLSMVDPLLIAIDLVEAINGLWEAKRARAPGGAGYRRILLIGHSLGAVLARKVYLLARGGHADVPFEPEAGKSPAVQSPLAAEWAARVDRIVLMAALSRGWTLDHALNRLRFLTMGLASLCSVLPVGNRLCIMHVRRNAPFLVNLRLQWLSMIRNAERLGGPPPAVTVQLLGSIDDLISPDDHVDVVTGGNFLYLDVPHTDHKNIIDIGGAAGGARKEIFQSTLPEDISGLQRDSVNPMDYFPRLVRKDVTDVVFVLHGIRDKGYWTHKMARRVVLRGRDAGPHPDGRPRVFETETANYGYFAMLPFLLPWARSEKVGWFMDQYIEAKAMYPDAEFSFIGHSNGTYLLAKALSLYGCCRFKRVVFAGSVVSSRYLWEAVRARGQVEEVQNYVASRDWVVALFPKVLQLLDGIFAWSASRFASGRAGRAGAEAAPAGGSWRRLLAPFQWPLLVLLRQDLGSAGHDGFVGFPRDRVNGPYREIRYVVGEHSAAIREGNWDRIAEFIVHGKTAYPPYGLYSEKPRLWYWVLGISGPFIWLAILWLVAAVGMGIMFGQWHWRLWFEPGLVDWSVFAGSGWRVFAFTAYCWALWKLLTRV